LRPNNGKIMLLNVKSMRQKITKCLSLKGDKKQRAKGKIVKQKAVSG
jgi:hypothetical protein